MPQLGRSLKENGGWIALRSDQAGRVSATVDDEEHCEPAHIGCVDGKPLSLFQQILKAALLMGSGGLMLMSLIWLV